MNLILRGVGLGLVLLGCKMDMKGGEATGACRAGLTSFFSKEGPDASWYHNALKIKPGYPGALAGLAMIESNTTDLLPEALKHADEAATAHGKSHILFFLRGVLKARLGDRAGFEEDLAKAKKLDPKFDVTEPVWEPLTERRNDICAARNW